MSEDIIKYTNKQIEDMQSKYISKNYSVTWYKKHFVEMMRYIKWVNGQKVNGKE